MSSGIEALVNREYAYGFVTDVETDTVPPGLNEDIIRLISAKKNEPAFMLEWRLKAHPRRAARKEAPWGKGKKPPNDHEFLRLFFAPENGKPPPTLSQIAPGHTPPH